MAKKYVSLRNLQFLLHDVLEATQITRLERYQDYDRDAFDLALDAAKQISDTYLFPIHRAMDQEKAYYKEGIVHTHPELGKAIKAIAEGGWISANADYEEGGQQMPWILLQASLFIFYTANANAAAYTLLTQSAAGLIRSFGDAALKEQYVSEMLSGNWQGTMALTEPQAGSSLTDVTTSATPTDAGFYKIKGQKIYISGGDHEHVENIVHLTLARIDKAPAGTKGISLFVVPKKRREDGELVNNDVTTAGIYGKMGQKGYVATHLMMGEGDDCRGWLVGQPHRGLPQMFQMMNEARIGTGNIATGTACAAYYAALQYANERPQGRHPSNKDATQSPVLIIEHADVRRMLFFQKAIVEGSLSLLLQCSFYADLASFSEGVEREKAHLLLELLTPICKSYASEMGTQAVSAGMQVLGGAGYTDDFPLEQYLRDIRVNAIYEGTTGIHGLDLLGRKVMMNKGKAVILFMQEITETIAKARAFDTLILTGTKLGQAARTLHKLTMHLTEIAMKERAEVFLADATLYLELFGIVTIAWQWLKQGVVATEALESGEPGGDIDFYQGKLFAMRYFFEYEVVKVNSLYQRLMSEDRLTLDAENSFLN